MELMKAKFTPMLECYNKAADHARRVVESTIFRVFVMAMALANLILIGLQTNPAIVKEHGSVLSMCDWIVLTVFLGEILLKICCSFWKFWKNRWNVVDVVVTMVVVIGSTSSTMDQRIVLILRVILSARALVYIKQAYMIICVLDQSCSAMMNMYLLIGGTLLMFGVMGVLLFGETVPSAFGDLTATLFTLFVCLTLDGWVDIQARFKDAGDESMYAAMAFFAVFICVGAFIFINLKITVLIANLHKVIEEREGPPEDSSPEVTHLEDVLDTSGQTPLTNLCFESLTIEHLENGLLVGKAVENTTTKLEGFYDELERIVEEVRAVPANRRHELELMRQCQAAATLEENILSSEVFSGCIGDILTTLMTLDEANIIDSSEGRPQVYSSGMIQKGVRRLSMVGAANSSSF